MQLMKCITFASLVGFEFTSLRNMHKKSQKQLFSYYQGQVDRNPGLERGQERYGRWEKTSWK